MSRSWFNIVCGILLSLFIAASIAEAASQPPEGLKAEEVDTYVENLSEPEVRSMLSENLKSDMAESDVQGGEQTAGRRADALGALFFNAAKATSVATARLGKIISRTASESEEWQRLEKNLTNGKGWTHFVTTLFMVALCMIIGFVLEYLARRPIGEIQHQVLAQVPLARFRRVGRFVSNTLLEAVGIGVFVLVTFVCFVLLFSEGTPRYLSAALILIGSYYVRGIIFVAKVVFSPKAPALRLLPLADRDANFMYGWISWITVVAAVITVASAIFRRVGQSEPLFLMAYASSGLAVSLMLVGMIWRSRKRIAHAICPENEAVCTEGTTLRKKFSDKWHYLAILYVVGAGIYWHANALIEGEGGVVKLIFSIFLIPVFIGIDQWGIMLLKVASGELPEKIDLGDDEQNEDQPPEAAERSKMEEGGAPKKDVAIYAPFLQRVFRVALVAFLFFITLRLWGIDLHVGRIFTGHVLGIVVTLLLGLIAWNFAKFKIDQKLKEEMPDADDEKEEGGAGGSRSVTLLLLLRKFIMAVLFIMVTMIVLSGIGVNIGPLIAGAGVVGLAIGFGAQTLVKDIIAGIFFLIDDAFRVGDYVETGSTKGMVEHISLRSVKLRHHRGMVHTIPFGGMGSVTNFSRDYIITKLDFRVRYDTDVDKVRKIIKKINKSIQKDPELAPVMLGKIKSQGVKQLDDSAMIMRVKFKTIPGEQFVVRREVFRRIQEDFAAKGIEFAHRNVTVYFPPEVSPPADNGSGDSADPRRAQAAAAAAQAAAQAESDKKN